MKKRTIAAALIAAPSFAMPNAAQASTRGDYAAGMAVAYCMQKEGGWTSSQGSRFFHRHMQKQGVSARLVSFYHDQKSTTREIMNTIESAGGCSSIVSRITNRSGGSTPVNNPSAVLSDTPFRF